MPDNHDLVDYMLKLFQAKFARTQGQDTEIPIASEALLSKWGAGFLDDCKAVVSMLVLAYNTPGADHILSVRS